MQNYLKIQKYLICAFVMLFAIKTNAQDSSIVKRKLNIEFSFYGFGSKNNVTCTQGKELAGSLISFNTGNTIRFSYEFHRNNAIGLGLCYYRKNISFDYTLEKETYNLPFSMYGPMEYTSHIVGLPVSYQHSVSINANSKLSTQLGYIISFPMIGNVDAAASYIENNQQKEFLVTTYNNPQKSNNLFFELGFHKTLKINELKFSLLSQIPLKNLVFANYTFFNEIPDKTSKGIVKSGLGYIGLNVSYILTHKKRK
jgi:hypothetical protein